MTKLMLTECKDFAYWDNFVATSPQGNIFCQTAFLDALGEDYELLSVQEDNSPKLGAIVLEREGQLLHAPYPFTMYQGVLFDGISCNMPYHRWVKWSMEITNFLLDEMEKRYDCISFCLHPHFEDLRSFSWFHYHEPDKGKFNINLWYTALLNLFDTPDFEAYLGTIRQSRRYEYRHGLENGLTVEVSKDVDKLDYLHKLTFERQGIMRNEDEVRLVRAISSAALAHGFGELLLCWDAEGEAISATLFLYDENCGYYMFGANDPAHRNSYGGTFLLLENIRRCQARGLRYVDMCGINSPNRGDFKTSFNAAPVPYFVVTWDKSL
ncbi:MAG TPA: GNAT family N-acetyltransferase [Candidatus Methanoperedens sp.]